MRAKPGTANRAGRGKRQQARLFQFKDQWLTLEANGVYSRAWYDAEGGRTRRSSLGTRDFEEAQAQLIAIVLGEPAEKPGAPETVTLASVFEFYSKNKKPHPSFKHALAFMKGRSPNPLPTVADFDLVHQRAFMRHMTEVKGLCANSISQYMSFILAALNFATRPEMLVDSQGRERVGQMLSAKWYVECRESAVAKVTDTPESEPVKYMADDNDVIRFIEAVLPDKEEHIFRYVIMALNTWARPEAICDLNVNNQVDFQRDLIKLNQPGRRQTTKRRPLIRLTNNLRGWFLHWSVACPLMKGPEQRIVREIPWQEFRRVSLRAGLPQFTRYSLRRYMNTRTMGMASREERSEWMGHTDQDHRITQKHYEHFNPDFLRNVAKAIDEVMLALDQKCAKTLVSPGQRPSSGLTLVENSIVDNAIDAKMA